MFNPLLWTLDNQTDSTTFERMCVDLLSREGYSRIVPIGGVHDAGRDAEIRELSGGITFFQFSLEESWQGKLRRELKKVERNGHTVDVYIFVTSRKVTGRKRDSLVKEAEHDFGWRLVLYDREWLRNRLEEQHPDLAAKYLGITDTSRTLGRQGMQVEHTSVIYAEKGDLYLKQENFEAAIVAYKQHLQSDSYDDDLWNAIAFCQYNLGRFDEALQSIQNAVRLNPKDIVHRTAHAAILTEHGIERGERVQLTQAKIIFKELIEEDGDWQSHYNYANVLAALGEHEAARIEYVAALSLNESAAPAWTNLGNTLSWLQDYDEAMRCYDKALAIQPDLQEALASKGTALLQLENKPEDAIPLIERAIGVDTFAVQWRQGWYWLGIAYLNLEQYVKSLECVNRGLDLLPGHLGLFNLKGSILSVLWSRDEQYINQSIEFFEFLHELGTATYPATEELAQLYIKQGRTEEAIKLLQFSYELPLADLDRVIQEIGRYDLSSVSLAFKHVSIYAQYRMRNSSIQAYFEPLAEKGIHITDDIIARASVVALVMFGISYEKLLRTDPLNRRTALESLHDIVLEHFKHASLQIYQELRSQLDSPDKEQVFALKVMVTNYSLIEWTNQLGWIAGRLQMSEEDMQAAIDKQLKAETGTASRWIEALGYFIRDDKDID